MEPYEAMYKRLSEAVGDVTALLRVALEALEAVRRECEALRNLSDGEPPP